MVGIRLSATVVSHRRQWAKNKPDAMGILIYLYGGKMDRRNKSGLIRELASVGRQQVGVSRRTEDRASYACRDHAGESRLGVPVLPGSSIARPVWPEVGFAA